MSRGLDFGVCDSCIKVKSCKKAKSGSTCNEYKPDYKALTIDVDVDIFEHSFFSGCKKCIFLDDCNIRDTVVESRRIVIKFPSCPYQTLDKNLPSDPEMKDRIIDILKDRLDAEENFKHISSEELEELDLEFSNLPAEFSKPTKTLESLGGLKNLKAELGDFINLIKNKDTYLNMGLKEDQFPTGLLLYGPPGCGKSTVAEALAGELGIPYQRCAGSEFVLKYVGVGAENIRKLFKRAREFAPSLIFIDEIDAVGGVRGRGENKESDSTLNQLLAEMTNPINKDIIVLGATNRVDMLDPALTRRGRLDRKIEVPLPDKSTRYEILELVSKNTKLSGSVNLQAIAEKTHGCCSADLEGIITESIMLAVREGKQEIDNNIIAQALDKVVLGTISDLKVIKDEKYRIAVHESGHALVSHLKGQKISRISTLPRGGSLGLVMHYSEDDKHLYTVSDLHDSIDISLAGLVAEELVIGTRSSGCSEDLKQASRVAKEMITRYGMSSEVGLVSLDRASIDTGSELTKLISQKLDLRYQATVDILTKNRDSLDLLINLLLDKEELIGEDIENLLRGDIECTIIQ